jgi:hypothetical protein
MIDVILGKQRSEPINIVSAKRFGEGGNQRAFGSQLGRRGGQYARTGNCKSHHYGSSIHVGLHSPTRLRTAGVPSSSTIQAPTCVRLFLICARFSASASLR